MSAKGQRREQPARGPAQWGSTATASRRKEADTRPCTEQYGARRPQRREQPARGRVAGALLIGFAAVVSAAPVEVYREGPQFCPRDRPRDGPVLSRAEAIERARTLLPRGFCALSRFVAGCDAETEFIEGTWRIFLHQYQLRGYRHDQRGLAHSYVILDVVGNCVANIPGSELGSRE